MGTWEDWKDHLEAARPVRVGDTERKLSAEDPLVILPSCRDMDIDACGCILCKAADLRENFDLYPQVPDEVWHATYKTQDPTAEPITEAEAQGIASLRRRQKVREQGASGLAAAALSKDAGEA